MTRLTEHRPENGHNDSKLHLRLADFDSIGPVVDDTPAVKRAATATVRRVVAGRGEQQLLLRMLYQKQFPRRPLGTVEQANAAKRGRA
jgi:hypothetical protein